MKIGREETWLCGAISAAATSLLATSVACTVLSRVVHARNPEAVLAWGFRLQGFVALPLTVFAFVALALSARAEVGGRGKLFALGVIIAMISILVSPAPAMVLYYSIPKLL
jgi:hypothetical protein